MKKMYTVLWLILCQQLLFSQGDMVMNVYSNTHLSQEEKKTENALTGVLHQIEKKFKVYFNFDPDLILKKDLEEEVLISDDLNETLERLLKPLGLQYQKLGNSYYAIFSERESGVKEDVKPIRNLPTDKSGDSDVGDSRRRGHISPLIPRQTDLSTLLKLAITGQVTDQQGEPLIGVNVLVKGTDKGTATDFEGNFTLEDVDEQAVLVVSYIGYQTQEVSVAGKSNITITLLEDSQTLDEVVVVGYGTQKKSDLTGSVESIDKQDIRAVPSANVMQAIRGRSSGVQVKQNNGHPGAPISVRIRGSNSIVGNNEPLYIVDGFPVSDATVINNSSIESIEVLKDASAVAIYGSRASNGVVLITTNRGEAGRTQVNLESSLGYQSLVKEMDFMNPFEWGTYINRKRINDGESERFSQNELNELAAMGEGTNWQDVLYQTAPIQNYSLNINGGNETTKFALTGSLFEQDGIIRNSGYNRYAITSKIVHDINSRLSVDVNLNYSRNKHDRKLDDEGRSSAGMINLGYGSPPIYPVYNDDGSFFEPVPIDNNVDHSQFNVLNYIYNQKNELFENNLLANTSLSYEILDNLILKVSGGIENRNTRSDSYTSKNYFGNPNGSASVSMGEFVSLLNENTLSYNNQFNKHAISAVAGFTFQDFTQKSLNGGGNTFLSDITETHDLATASNFSNPNTNYTYSALLSGLGRINYKYDNRYLFTVSFRADGSSKYSEGNKWGFFPSAAFSWRLSEEDFLNLNNNFVSDVKLRLSWGQAGNQAISAYSTLNRLNPGSSVFGSSLVTTMAPGSRLASDLRWETTEQWNIGLEAEILDGRFRLTADYYNKETRDLLNAVQLPRTTGYTNTLRNVGRIENSGIEFSASTYLINSEDFSWNITANISFNRSRVLELYEGQDILAGQVNMIAFTAFANTYREGEPLGQFYGYEEDGYDESGSLKYKSDELVKIGDPNPDFIFGLNTALTFKDFTLTAFFQGSQGNDLINLGMISWTVDNRFEYNKLREVLDNSWTPNNPNAKYPAPSAFHDIRFSDRWVNDGSYVKLRNIELAYNIPIHSMRRLNVYVSGQNLLTLTKYPWIDPDVNTRGGGSSLAQGIDWSSYPPSKSLTFGLRLGF